MHQLLNGSKMFGWNASGVHHYTHVAVYDNAMTRIEPYCKLLIRLPMVTHSVELLHQHCALFDYVIILITYVCY